MVRTIVKLLVVALVVHAAVRVTPVYVAHLRFKERLHETARFAGRQSEAEVIARVIETADALGVPVERSGVLVRRDRSHVSIDVSYTRMLEILPAYPSAWTFTARVDAPSFEP